MNTFSILKSLTPQETDFLQTEQISAEETSSEWISFFKKSLEFDKKADPTRRKFMALAILSLIFVPIAWFLILSVFAVIIPIDYAFIAFIPAFLAAFLIFGVSVFSFYKYFKLRKYNIKCNQAIISKVLPVLSLLREEVKPNQKIKLNLDLRNPQSSENFVGKSPAYAKGVYHKVVDSDYKNEWMNGETFLADGTLLIWTIQDLIREQKKTKKNFRGKYKTKYKYKNKTFISLQAGVERKQFTLPAGLKQKGAEGAMRTKKQGKYDWIQIQRMFKLGTNEFHVKYFIDTIASVYMRAKPNINQQT